MPRGAAAEGSFHFVGVQIAEAEVFRTLPPGVPRAVIGGGRPGTGNAGVYDDLIRRQPGRIRGVVSETAFWDIGTVADYFATCLALSDTPADRVVAGRGGLIDPSATVTRCILWDDVEVGAGCRLDGCIVTDGVRVPAGRAFRDAVLIEARGGWSIRSSTVRTDRHLNMA